MKMKHLLIFNNVESNIEDFLMKKNLFFHLRKDAALITTIEFIQRYRFF